eukprot:GHVR01042339.1.p1 GENE.GHVR01042339.1~~GHVR01042339.1.p1  ORF type:complete len:150 (+),score=49.10 GHVR01042339.1:93-542(+)
MYIYNIYIYNIPLYNMQVGLSGKADGKKRPLELSGGMLRRACLAQILSQGKHVAVLDEPFVGLDESTAVDILNMLLDVQMKSGICYIIVSHTPTLVKALHPKECINIVPQRRIRMLGYSGLLSHDSWSPPRSVCHMSTLIHTHTHTHTV